MDNLIQFIILHSALDGDRGASIKRIWHFVSCFYCHSNVHPLHTRSIPNCSPISSINYHHHSSIPDLDLDPNAPIPSLDWDLLQHIWSILIDLCPEYIHLVQRILNPNSTLRAPIPSKKWKTADKASLALNKATPLETHVIATTPLSQLLANHGDMLKLYIPPLERTSILRKNECGDMSEQLSKVYDEILYRRVLGCTQADLSKTLTIDPRSVFYFTKLLAAKDCIFKVPVSSNGQSTQLCLATQFAPFNHAYQSFMAGSASIPRESFTLATETAEPDPIVPKNALLTNKTDTSIDQINEDSADSTDVFPSVAVKTFPPAEDVFASPKSQNKDIPCIIGELIRTRICSILQAQPRNTLASEPLLHAVGLRPMEFPRHRKWFNTAVGVLCKQGQLEVFKTEAPIDTASAVLTPLQFKAWNAATFERTHGPTVRICKLVITNVNQLHVYKSHHVTASSVHVPETDNTPTFQGHTVHDPTLIQQDGVLFDLPFEYQILRLLANAPLGLTGLQLRRQLGGLSAKMFNKFMERFTIPKKNAPDNAVVLRRACESRGRERRNRYFADFVDPSFLSALRSVRVVSSNTLADTLVTINTDCSDPPVSSRLTVSASQAIPSLPNESINPSKSSHTGIETPPLTLSMSLYNLNSQKNVTEQTKQRRIVMLDILSKERVLEYNKDLLRVFDEAYNARFPFVTTDNHDSAQIIKNQRSTAQSHRPFMDKTTMWRVVDYLRRECSALEHRVLNIPLVHGGSKYREFLIYRNANPPVTHEEIIHRAQATERSQHLGANGWSISTGWNEIGAFGAHQPTLNGASSIVNDQQPSEQFVKNWRAISIEYGWIDSRILRARKLYHLLYCKTRVQYEANPLGASPVLESSLINSSLTFGMYLSLIGHTRKSHVIQAAMHDHQDTPLSEIDRNVMAEIMGSEKKVRRFRNRLGLLLNILIALNLIHPFDPHNSALNLPNYNTVTENMPIYPAYAIPRKVYLLDYLSSRSERTVQGEFDLSTEFQVIMYWETLRILCVTKPVTKAIQDSHNVNLLDSEARVMGMTQSFTDLIPDSIGRVQWGMGNRDLDPIKFIRLTTNWFSTFRFLPAVKRELKREYQKLRRSGQIPSTIHPVCLEVARKIMAPVEQVKRYFRLLEHEQPITRSQKVGRSKGGDTEEGQQDTQKRPRSPSTTRSTKRQRISGIDLLTSNPVGSGLLQDGQDVMSAELLEENSSQVGATLSRQRRQYSWSKQCDHLLLVCYVIMRHRQLIGMAPRISWQLASTYFINLNREAMRNRIIRLLHRSDNILKVKELHQAWVAHVSHCPQCDTHSELVFDHPTGIVSGYHNLDLHTAIPHLAGVSISEMKAGSLDVPELPDSLEELHQNFHCLINQTCASRDPTEAISSHLRLVDMYEKAWYISGSESTSTNLFSPLELDKDLVNVHSLVSSDCQSTTRAQNVSIEDDTFMDTSPTQPNESAWFQGEDLNKIALVTQLLKMICLTPESQYDSSLAFILMSQFTAPVVECAINRAHNEGILVKKTANVRSRLLPHRRYTLSERFTDEFLGQDAQLHIAQALMSLKELRSQGDLPTNCQDRNTSPPPLMPGYHQFILNDFVNEGTMLALIDLMVTRDVNFSVHFDMGELLGCNILPAPIRQKDINPLVYVQVLTSLPKPTPLFDLETGQLPSTHPLILAQGPTSDIMQCGLQVQGRPDLSNPDAGWAIQVGLDEHVWIDTSDAPTMQIHTLAKHPNGMVCDYFDKDMEVGVYNADVHPQLRTRIIPRIWNDIHGNVTPAILRSALTSVLAFLMRHPGAGETWMREKLKVIFTSTEVTELVSQLIYRGAVSAQVVEGSLNRYLFLTSGFFYRIL